MLPSLQWKDRPDLQAKAAQWAPALGSLLTPAAAVSTGMALWRLGSDLKWTGEFAISNGIFAHWQVWAALAVGLQFGATYLKNQGAKSS
jgi:hypothetical protein